MATNVAFPKDMQHSLSITMGVPMLLDITYGFTFSRTSLYLRPGIGWFLFYKINNEGGWELFPEVSLYYALYHNGNLEVGPDIGLAYIHHHGYDNSLASSNYSAKSKADMLFENIRARAIWHGSKTNYLLAGNIGVSLIEYINQHQIIEHNVTRHETDIRRARLFPLLSVEAGCTF